MHLSLDTKYYSFYFNLYRYPPCFPKNLYYFQNIRDSLSLSLFPSPHRFLRSVVLCIEIDFAGYNRLLMCSLIPPKKAKPMFCLIYSHTKMTFFYFKLTLCPNHCYCPHTSVSITVFAMIRQWKLTCGILV
jgi:hypothetical protein